MSNQIKPPSISGWKKWLPPLFLAAVCVGIYADALHNTFLQDDVYNITENNFIRHPAEIPKLFTRDYFPLSQEGAYRPIPTFVFMMDHLFFGYHVEGWRMVNLSCHIASVLMLFFLLAMWLEPSMGRDRARLAGFFAALLFAVHPAHSQAMSVISYNKDLLCCLFLLVTLHLYTRGRYLAAMGTFVLSLFSKEMAVTLPAVLVLYELLLAPGPERAGKPLGSAKAAARLERERPAAKIDYRQRLKAHGSVLAAFFILSILYVYGRFRVFNPTGIIMEVNSEKIAHWPKLSEALVNTLAASVTYLRYLRMLAWPVSMSVDWDGVLGHVVTTPEMMLAGLVTIALLLWAAWERVQKAPAITFGILYFLGVLLPVSGIIPFWSSLAERYIYVPSLGIFLIAGLALEWVWTTLETKGKRALAVCLVLLAPAALAARTVVRNLDYRDDITIFQKESVDHPESYAAWYGLGFAKGRRMDYAGAKEAFQKSAALDTYYKTHFMLAFDEEKLNGSEATVEAEYKKAIEIEPDYFPPHFNLGALYHRQGRLDLAIVEYQETLRINPDYREARANLGAAELALGRYSDAVVELEKALATRPELENDFDQGLEAKMEYNLATALFNLDNNTEALDHYRRAIALDASYEKKPPMKYPKGKSPSELAQAQAATPAQPGAAPDLAKAGAAEEEAAAAQAAAAEAAAAPPAAPEAAPAPPAPLQGPSISKFGDTFPSLKSKLMHVENVQYDSGPDGYKPQLGYHGSAQSLASLKPEEKAALDDLARRQHAPDDLSVTFSTVAADMNLSQGSISLDQRLMGTKPVEANVEGGVIQYPGAYPDATVFYIADARSVEQLIYLDSPKAPTRFDMEVSVPGSLRKEADGTIAMYDANGGKKLQLSPPVVIDAKGKQAVGKLDVRPEADAAAQGALRDAPNDGKSHAGPSKFVLSWIFDVNGLTYPLLVDPTWTSCLYSPKISGFLGSVGPASLIAR